MTRDRRQCAMAENFGQPPSEPRAKFAMTSVVRVEIDAREHDRDLPGKFIMWQGKSGVYPIRGGVSADSGRYVAFFDVCDADAVRAFFAEHKAMEFEAKV